MNDLRSYLMEDPLEADRLEAKTDPAITDRLLSAAGLRPGMRALDAGAGTGAVARSMSRIVGGDGSVVAADRSEHRLERGRREAAEAGLANLTFVAADLEHEAVPSGPYDFVWCRFVFEYLQNPDRALDHLVRATRIGGKVVVADLDGNATFHHPFPEPLRAGLERVLASLAGRFDPYAGRKLYERFRRRGLTDVRVHVEPYHLYAGAAPREALANWEQKLRVIRPAAVRAFDGEAGFDRWAEGFLDLLRSPETFTYSVLMVVEGIRPA